MAVAYAPEPRQQPSSSGEKLRGAVPHLVFFAAEAILLLLLAGLTIAVKTHGGPLPGDIGVELDLQHWLRPHHQITSLLDLTSAINWPVPSAITVAAIAVLLLVLRRWLDVAVLLVLDGLGDGVDYFFSHWVHRARPSGHGIYVASKVTSSFSFPSGHVLQALMLFGFVLFLTFQVRRPAAAWLWPIRLLLLYLVLAMGPSRILEGEHWPSDVLAGWVYGGFWLVLGIHTYFWAARRWPRARGRATLHRGGNAYS